MQIENFKLINKPPIICAFHILFPKMGLMIRDFKLMESHGKRWIGPPARSYQDESGVKKWFSFVTFSENRKEAFDAAVLRLLEPLLQVPPASSHPDMEDLPF
jgi:hypothetical protein